MKKRKEKLARLQVLMTPKEKKDLEKESFKTRETMSSILLNAWRISLGIEVTNKRHNNGEIVYVRPRNIFSCLLQRCKNQNNKDYKYYGGRGIKCEWKNFEDFWKDMESSYAEDLTIDRINNDGNYSKENCRWVASADQQKNRRDSKDWNFSKK